VIRSDTRAKLFRVEFPLAQLKIQSGEDFRRKQISQQISSLHFIMCPRLGSPFPPGLPLSTSRFIQFFTMNDSRNLFVGFSWCSCSWLVCTFLNPSWWFHQLDDLQNVHTKQLH